MKMNRTPTKVKWKNTFPFYIVFQVLKVFLIKRSKNSHQIFFCLLFLLAFTSADIIFHKFLELHSTLSEKSIFVTNFSFLNDSLNPFPLSHPLNGQNLLRVTKVFCRCSLKCCPNFFKLKTEISFWKQKKC